MSIDNQGGLHVPVTRVNSKCEECGSTNYPNLQYNLPGVGTGVLCRPCLNKVVEEINQALRATSTDNTNKDK